MRGNASILADFLSLWFEDIDDKMTMLAKKSEMIMNCKADYFIGKYMDEYWISDPDGVICGVGKELQNLPFFLMEAATGKEPLSNNPEYIEEIIEMFKNQRNLDYFQYLEEYKQFCLQHGVVFNPHTDVVNRCWESKFTQWFNNASIEDIENYRYVE